MQIAFRLLLAGSVFAAATITNCPAAVTPSFSDRQDYAGCSSDIGAAFAIADVNGDGVPDLVCSGYSGIYGIKVSFGNGDGTFGAGPTTSLNYFTDNLILLDVSGDGKVDVVAIGAAGNDGPDGIVVSLGNGDGTFQPGTLYQTGSDRNLASVVAGDFNGDGIPDVATQGESGIWFFTGLGGGLLSPGKLMPVKYPTDGDAELVAVDLNRDGKLDLVASNSAGFNVLFGNGDGTFQPEIDTSCPFLGGGNGFAVGDLNGDGQFDVIEVSEFESFGLLYLGNGNGTFAAPTGVNLGSDPLYVAITDANGDGFPDVVASTGYVAYGNGKGQFSNPVSYPISGYSSLAGYVTSADLRHDGLNDLLFYNTYFSTVSVLLSEGRGVFLDVDPVTVSGGTASCGISADFNGDGIPDLAIGVSEGISILLGTGKARSPYIQGVVLQVPSPGCMVQGDLNKDGNPDLLIPSGSPSGTAIAFLGNGDGTFTQVGLQTQMPTTGVLVIGDFNGDGKLDWASSSNLLAFGNGDGTFQTPTVLAPNLQSVAIGGIASASMANGHESEIVLTAPGSFITGHGNVYILWTNGTGGFQQTVLNQSGSNYDCVSPYSPLLADVNGDGRPDLLVSCQPQQMQVFVSEGNGKFVYRTQLAETIGADTLIPLVADVDGDGIPDIIIASDYEAAVYVGQGSVMFANPIYLGKGENPGSVLAVKAHGQPESAGKPDLVVINPDVELIVNTTK